MGDVGTFLVGIYLLISQLMSVIFFIDICKTWDSIIGIILLGPIVAEFKGIFWIFTIW